MGGLSSFFRSLYLTSRFFFLLLGMAVISALGFFFPVLYGILDPLLLGSGGLVAVELFLLYRPREGVRAQRNVPEKLSNGDQNRIRLYVRNDHPFSARIDLVDELPVQLQIRDGRFSVRVGAGESRELAYQIRPTERGEYAFGALNVFVESPLGLLRRRYRFPFQKTVPVYPAFLKMRRFELLAFTDRLHEVGVKRIRRVGQSLEFDRIREYVQGDDQRTINWKATARRGKMMVNQYQDERAQPVYSLIDMGRAMKMPFDGMTLLDHAINAALVISNIALYKKDRAGLVTFSHQVHAQLPASRRSVQMQRILELLYRQRTDFLESDHRRLSTFVKRKVTQRGLLLLFTNFETLSGMRRQLPYLRKLARDHLLLVVFFRNRELDAFVEQRPVDTEMIYQQTLARQFIHEKEQIAAELTQYGVYNLFTAPEELTVNTINHYLEFKSRGLI